MFLTMSKYYVDVYVQYKWNLVALGYTGAWASLYMKGRYTSSLSEQK